MQQLSKSSIDKALETEDAVLAIPGSCAPHFSMEKHYIRSRNQSGLVIVDKEAVP